METNKSFEFDSTPELIRNGTLDFADYMLSMNGLISDSVPWIDIDHKFQLIQSHPNTCIYVCPILPAKQPTVEEIWNINDFLSYKNEVPSIPIPDESSFENLGYEFLYGRELHNKIETCHHYPSGEITERVVKPLPKYKTENAFFIDSQSTILSEIPALKFGPFSFVEFYLPVNKTFSISLENDFLPAQKEIRFYAMALRQYDFLAELLCYYRIFESISPKKHFNLLNDCINEIASFNFGKLFLRNTQEDYQVKPQNLYTLMKRRAITQIKKINSMNIVNIGEYLYTTERCEIAHGKYSNKVSDFGRDYFSSYNNMLIVKLAAKIAIHNKISKNFCGRTTAST